MHLNIAAAARLLQQAECIAVPTETVYGLAGNASDSKAVAAIFARKQRPAHNPLIVHVRDAEQASSLVDWTPLAATLAAAFWPGPLTLVLPVKGGAALAPAVLAGQATLAVRCPAHALMQTLLRQIDFPLAAPSANPSGRISPTTAAHVRAYWPDMPVLDGGACAAGLESTIVALYGADWQVLRPGTITAAAVQGVIGQPPVVLPQAPVVPGQDARHYAPLHRMRLNATDVADDEGLLAFGSPLSGARVTLNLSTAGDMAEAAQNLYTMLHTLDAHRVAAIAVMPIPTMGIGAALNNRLARAAAGALLNQNDATSNSF